jgi:hypothetical protein
MDMRAEVIYAWAEQAAADQAATDPTGPSTESSLPAPGAASVSVDDDQPEENPGNERTSALQRLIGSLRRKDH